MHTDLPEVTDSVMFRLLSESPKDWREEEEEAVLEDSEGGLAGLAVFPVSAFSRSFSAFNISISFYHEDVKCKKTFEKMTKKILSDIICMLVEYYDKVSNKINYENTIPKKEKRTSFPISPA